MKSELILGDSREILTTMPDSSVDLIITDSPYGIDYNSNWSKDEKYRKRVKSVNGIANDQDNIEFLSKVIIELYRILKNNSHIYWFTRWDKSGEHIELLQNAGFKVKNNLIWMKNNWSMGDLKGSYAGQYENIIFAQKGRRELNEVDGRSRHTDILQFDRVPPSRLRHSHEKPVNLLKFLIEKSSCENEIILDPFMGVGSVGKACEGVNRNFIGIELDLDYFNIAQQRIQTEKEKINEEKKLEKKSYVMAHV